MKKALGWLLLSAFSLGLSFDLPKGLRTLLGVCGLVLGTIGFLFASSDQTSALSNADSYRPDVDRPDLHEALVAESFDRLSPMEAATVVGVLHHYRVAPSGHDKFCVNALELHAAIDLVARATGFPKGLLRGLYYDHWIELREAPARRICERLERHDLVRELFAFPDVG